MSGAISTIGPAVTSAIVSAVVMGVMRIAIGKTAICTANIRAPRFRYGWSSGNQKGQDSYDDANSNSQRSIKAVGICREMESQNHPDQQY